MFGCRALAAVPMISAGRRSSVATGTAIVGGDRHERRIGAVLQQAPHQIGQQIAVAADRRIGPAGEVGTVLAQLRVQRLAHAVQALKLEAACRHRASSRTVATVSALWVANCGKMRGRSASSCCAQAM